MNAITLKDHQNEANQATIEALEAGKRRITLEMATGSGKSYTQAALINDRIARGETTIVVTVPTQDLVAQNASSYKEFLSGVGIDASVVGVFAPKEDSMAAACDATTTRAEEIVALDKQARESGRPSIIIATYQSMENLQEACTQGLQINTLLADEAHRMASGDAEDAPGLFARPLFDDFIPCTNRVFYTATLRGDQDTGISMNNAALFGDCVYSLGYRRAVDLGILREYKAIPVPIERAEIEEAMVQAGLDVSQEDTSESRALARAFAAVLMAKGAVETRRAAQEPLSMMVMHPSRKMAEQYNEAFQEEMTKEGSDLPCMVVHGEATDEKERALQIGRSLKGEMSVSVVDMFREGTDMPGLNTLLLARNTKSSIVLIQAMGRIVRLYKNEWADENGNLPEKTPQILVPVIVDSRDPNDKPDGSLAAELFSAMLRTDEQLRGTYQQACAQEGRDFVQRQAGEPEAPKAQEAVMQAFMIDDSALGKSIAQSIAQATRSQDAIGEFDRKASMYEAWLEGNQYEAPTLPSAKEIKEADTPQAQKEVVLRKELVLWHQNTLHRHAKKMLYAEEAKRIHEMKGFSFMETQVDNEKMLGHFDAYVAYTGRRPEQPSSRAEALAGQRLARFAYEASQIALEGERKDSRGRPRPRQKGDTVKQETIKVLAEREASRGEVPTVFGFKDQEKMTLRGKVINRECPVTGKSQLGFVPQVGERLPSGAVRHYQPFLPLSYCEAPLRAQLERHTNQVVALGLSMQQRRGVPVANVTGVEGLQVIRERPAVDPEVEKIAQVLEAQPLGVRVNAEMLDKGADAKPVGAQQVGWEGSVRDLVRKTASLRRQHAEGKMPLTVAQRLDGVAAFSWVEPEDYKQECKSGKEMVAQPVLAVKAMLNRVPEALDRSVLAQDTAVSNTIKDSQNFIARARQARARAVALGDDPLAKGQIAMWNKATKLMRPNIEAFRVWASWLDATDPLPAQKQAVAAPVTKQRVENR